jgi:DNA-binding transcriptional regulator LsrR (DeoR family)
MINSRMNLSSYKLGFEIKLASENNILTITIKYPIHQLYADKHTTLEILQSEIH